MCCVPQHRPVRATRGDEMDCFWMKKSAHSVLLVQGTGAGLGVGRRVWVSVWPRGWHYTPTFPLRLNCFKVLNRKKKNKKEIWLALSHHTPCGESATDLQMGSRETDKATDGQEDVSQIEEHESNRQTDRQRHLRETDREAAGRPHWLLPRLHKQLQLWT